MQGTGMYRRDTCVEFCLIFRLVHRACTQHLSDQVVDTCFEFNIVHAFFRVKTFVQLPFVFGDQILRLRNSVCQVPLQSKSWKHVLLTMQESVLLSASPRNTQEHVRGPGVRKSKPCSIDVPCCQDKAEREPAFKIYNVYVVAESWKKKCVHPNYKMHADFHTRPVHTQYFIG